MIEQYKSTFFYYMAIFTSVYFMGTEPVLKLALYDLFNNWSIYTIVEFVIYWLLSLYTIILSVATPAI